MKRKLYAATCDECGKSYRSTVGLTTHRRHVCPTCKAEYAEQHERATDRRLVCVYDPTGRKFRGFTKPRSHWRKVVKPGMIFRQGDKHYIFNRGRFSACDEPIHSTPTPESAGLLMDQFYHRPHSKVARCRKVG